MRRSIRFFVVLAVLSSSCTREAPRAEAVDDGRPAEAAKGPLAARVLHHAGDVAVDDGRGRVFPAGPSVGLLETDVVRVAPRSYALLSLPNRHVVRLDEDLALKVGDVLLLRAPEAKASVDEQVKALLRPEELSAISPADLKERVAGWQARAAAAETIPFEASVRDAPAPEAAPATAEPEAPKAVAEASPPPAATKSAPLDVGALGDEDGAPAQRVGASSAGGSDGARAARSGLKEESPTATGKADRGGAPTWPVHLLVEGGALRPVPAPPGVARLAADGALATCLRAHLDALGVPPQGALPVVVRFAAGRIAGVRLGGAVPVPACARAALGDGIEGAPADGALQIDVPLP